MSATVSLHSDWEPKVVSVVSYPEPARPGCHGGYRDVRAKKLVFSTWRAAMVATVAAVALTAVEPSLARAGSAGKGLSTATGSSDATDFSARRRYYRGGGGAAAAAAFAGIVGTGIAIAAAQNRRDDYYYGGAPAYYGGGPVYYGGTLLRQSAVLRWRIWLSPVQRPLFQRSSGRGW